MELPLGGVFSAVFTVETRSEKTDKQRAGVGPSAPGNETARLRRLRSLREGDDGTDLTTRSDPRYCMPGMV